MKKASTTMEAFRERARTIGILHSCVCTFPVERHATTESGHHESCPADYMTKMYEQMLRGVAATPVNIGPDMLRAYAAEWNRIADAAFTCLIGSRTDGIGAGILDDEQLAASRARAVALRLEELALHLEQTR
ncbi:MAG TPA: hypothetical protein VGF94_08060 [Kofleriaceae bacterium]|jgi:hypothetical protein